MGKFKSRIYRFMCGRYGADTLGKVLLITYFAIVLVHSVLTFFIDSPLYDLISMAVSLTLAIIVVCRMFSRKIEKRRRENQKFCAFFRLQKNKLRDRKTHVFRKCPHCRAVLRLPRAKGKHSVICPKCKKRFQAKG